jgi:hypothetical protein
MHRKAHHTYESFCVNNYDDEYILCVFWKIAVSANGFGWEEGEFNYDENFQN